MVRVPLYLLIVVCVAILLRNIPRLFRRKAVLVTRILFYSYLVAALWITVIFRYIKNIIKAAYEQAHPWTPDPTAPVIVGQAGSTWLAQQQGIGGLRILWIALSDPNSLLNIIPSCILNVLFFMPLGMLLPCMYMQFRRNRATCVMIGLILSLGIEIIQLITGLGVADWKDLVCNTAGTFLGYQVWERFLQDQWRRYR